MAKFLDADCNVEFDKDSDYLLHKKAGHKGHMEHTTPIEAPPEPTPPPGVPPESLPTPEFMEAISRIEGKNKAAVEASVVSQHPTEMPPAQPIALTYKYVGECPEHRSAIDTFEIDVDKKHFCIAVCPADKKQLETREVAKL